MKRIGLVFPKITTNLAIKIIFEKRKKKCYRTRQVTATFEKRALDSRL